MQIAIPRKKKVGGGEGMVSGSRMSLFKRLSKCGGGGSLAACGANNLQATAPGDLAGSRWRNGPIASHCSLDSLSRSFKFGHVQDK